MTMIDGKRLAIIGGGASAAIFLIQFACKPEARHFCVDVYDRAGCFAKGIAYGTEFMSHRLNVRAANMSAYAEDSADFALWLKETHHLAAHSFAPRIFYAEYLAERLKQAQKTLNINWINKEVVSCNRNSACVFSLKSDNAEKIYDTVIQVTGNSRLIAPTIKNTMTNYVREPWYKEDYKNIPGKDGTAVILGSGLSAVDAIAALKECNYQGKITVISRNGWFPCVHVDPVKHPAFTMLENLSPSNVMQRLRREISKAKKEDIPWQAVIDSLRSRTNEIWMSWDKREKKIFMRKALTLWNIHRHRMSPETAALIDGYRSNGTINVVKDSILHLEGPDKIVLKNQTMRADMVINALGYRYDDGRYFDSTYKIGPVRFGELFETTAIPEIRAQAETIVNSLFKI